MILVTYVAQGALAMLFGAISYKFGLDILETICIMSILLIINSISLYRFKRISDEYINGTYKQLPRK